MACAERPRRFHARTWFIALVGLFAAAALTAAANPRKPDKAWIAPARAVHKANPVAIDEQSLALGQKLYMRECRSCHGVKGLGDGKAGVDLKPLPTDLTDPALWDQSDGALYWKITEGRDDMPGHRDLMTENERWHVVNYMRSLAKRPPINDPQFAAPAECRSAISEALKGYTHVHEALAQGDRSRCEKAAVGFASAARAMSEQSASGLDSNAQAAWTTGCKALTEAHEALTSAGDLEEMRAAFTLLSGALISLVEQFGHDERSPALVYSTGASRARAWIQLCAPPRNPYGLAAEPSEPDRRIGATRSTPGLAAGD